MSLFEITPDIQKLAEPASEGWHPAVINSIKGRLSNAGGKMTLFTFKITGPMIENSKIDNKGLFAFYNVNHDYLQYSLDFLSTITGIDLRKNAKKLFNSAEEADKALKGKAYEVYVEVNEYEGRKSNNVTKIREVGSGKKMNPEKATA